MQKAKRMIYEFWVGLILILAYVVTNVMHGIFQIQFQKSFLDDMRYSFYFGLIAVLGVEFFKRALELVIAYKKGVINDKTQTNETNHGTANK